MSAVSRLIAIAKIELKDLVSRSFVDDYTGCLEGPGPMIMAFHLSKFGFNAGTIEESIFDYHDYLVYAR